jgi:type I restriction enzyme R subunit
MALGAEAGAVQRPFIRYAVEAGWTYLSPDEALNLRQGGVTSPVLDAVLLGQLAKLNPGIVNTARAQDIVRRLLRVRPSIEGNLDAWEFLKGLKTVFVDTEKRERNVRLLDPVNVDANQFHIADEFTFSNGTPADIRLDIVFFVNGVPVLPVETKKATAMDGIAQALDDLRHYHRKGPELLALGQLHALTHRHALKGGSRATNETKVGKLFHGRPSEFRHQPASSARRLSQTRDCGRTASFACAESRQAVQVAAES